MGWVLTLMVAGFALTFGLFGYAYTLIGRLSGHIDRLWERVHEEPTVTYDDGDIRAAVATMRGDVESWAEHLDTKLKKQTAAIAEGIERVDRSERRIKATIARAQEKLAAAGYADPGVEAEAAELHLLDGGGVGPEDVQAVQPGLGDAGDEPSSVPGLSVRQLQRVRGL